MKSFKLLEVIAQFQLEMYYKLERKEAQGETGWDNAAWKDACRKCLQEHVDKAVTREDWVDVANFSMFMWYLTVEENTLVTGEPE